MPKLPIRHIPIRYPTVAAPTTANISEGNIPFLLFYFYITTMRRKKYTWATCHVLVLVYTKSRNYMRRKNEHKKKIAISCRVHAATRPLNAPWRLSVGCSITYPAAINKNHRRKYTWGLLNYMVLHLSSQSNQGYK